MANSFICYSPYSTINYEKIVLRPSQACLLKFVKAITSIMIKKYVIYDFYIFLAFKKIDIHK